MQKFEIKRRFTGNVLYAAKAESLAACVEAAIKAGSNLRGSDLSGSNLSGSNLSNARGITPKVLQIIGSAHLVIVRDYGMVTIGCHHKPLAWWEENYEAVGRKEEYTEEQITEYARHIKSAREFMEQYNLLEAPPHEAAQGEKQ